MSTTITLSDRTLALLSNFETICPSITLEPGKKLRTINDSNTVIAFADIEEDFPFEFPILDLTKLLAILRLPSFKKCQIEMNENYLMLKGENSQLQFWRSAAKLAEIPPGDIVLPSVEFEATATPEQIKELTRACSTLGHKTVRLVVKGGKTYVVGTTTIVDNSNDYTVCLGDSDKADFVMPLDVSNMKMIEGNYVITASGEGMMAQFQSVDGQIKYLVGMQIE